MKKQIFVFAIFSVFAILFNFSLLQSFSIRYILETVVSFFAGFYICQIGIFGRNKRYNEREDNSRLKQFLQVFFGILFLIIATYMFFKTQQETYVFVASAAIGVLASGVVMAFESQGKNTGGDGSSVS